jgi:outer membrane protein assembly factor BamA
VASLKIDGVHAFKEDEVLGVIASTPGQPYSEFNVATDRDNILALYFNEGFPEAKFTATAEKVNAETNKPSTGTDKGTQAAAANSEQNADKTNKAKNTLAYPAI